MILLSLYFGFFFVQLTANFELKNTYNYNKFSSPTNSVKSTRFNYFSTAVFSSVSKKCNVRLNKRFFPESFKIINKIKFEIEPVFISEPTLICYSNPSIVRKVGFSISRRGPPVV
jgi:hypothetical protein